MFCFELEFDCSDPEQNVLAKTGGGRLPSTCSARLLRRYGPQLCDPDFPGLCTSAGHDRGGLVWGPDKSRVSAYWPHGLLCLSCHCVGWVFPLNSGEPKCVGAKKLIREPPQSNHIHPSKRTNVV